MEEEKFLGSDRSIVVTSDENKTDLMTEQPNNVKIDVEEFTKIIEAKLDCNMSMPLNCSIFQVPTILSRHSPTSYMPNQFSIGPFHHRNKTLKRTERIKWKYLRDLLSRNPSPKTNILPYLSRVVFDTWEEAREYYAGPINMESNEFVEVLMLDGCFIVELFRKKSYDFLQENDDPIFTMPCLLQFLLHDLILLENQVPWMVLEKLFDMTKISSIDTKPLARLAMEFFGPMFSTKSSPFLDDKVLLSNLAKSKHILDLLRNSLILPFNPRKLKEEASYHDSVAAMQSATRLKASGVKFRPRESSSILDIEFSKKTGVFGIPQLFIQETTQTVFRNLIALEQCCPNYDTVVTCYAVLLDNLINTRADIETLCKNGAVETWLNMDDASKFFDKLYIDTYVREGFYLKISRDVREYCKRPWNRWMKTLWAEYFHHPWAIISFVAALFILVLTFLQTFYAIKKPN